MDTYITPMWDNTHSNFNPCPACRCGGVEGIKEGQRSALCSKHNYAYNKQLIEKYNEQRRQEAKRREREKIISETKRVYLPPVKGRLPGRPRKVTQDEDLAINVKSKFI